MCGLWLWVYIGRALKEKICWCGVFVWTLAISWAFLYIKDKKEFGYFRWAYIVGLCWFSFTNKLWVVNVYMSKNKFTNYHPIPPDVIFMRKKRNEE